MSETIVSEKINNAPLKLPPVLDLAAAEGLARIMQERCANDGSFGLDASEVEILSYPCAQIILAALKGGAAALIASPSAAFATAFEDLGIILPEIQIAYDAGAAEPALVPASVADTMPADAGSDPQSLVGSMAKRILTIDDSKTMRDMLMLTLVDAGFDVVQAVDGQDGLDVLGKEKVDVIITDINMPRMDGYEVIRRLRGNPDFKKTPILVLTTENELAKKNLAREVGATGWMVKPFDPDRLVATVRKVAN